MFAALLGEAAKLDDDEFFTVLLTRLSRAPCWACRIPGDSSALIFSRVEAPSGRRRLHVRLLHLVLRFQDLLRLPSQYHRLHLPLDSENRPLLGQIHHQPGWRRLLGRRATHSHPGARRSLAHLQRFRRTCCTSRHHFRDPRDQARTCDALLPQMWSLSIAWTAESALRHARR